MGFTVSVYGVVNEIPNHLSVAAAMEHIERGLQIFTDLRRHWQEARVLQMQRELAERRDELIQSMRLATKRVSPLQVAKEAAVLEVPPPVQKIFVIFRQPHRRSMRASRGRRR